MKTNFCINELEQFLLSVSSPIKVVRGSDPRKFQKILLSKACLLVL